MLQLSQCKLSWQEDSFSKLQKKWQLNCLEFRWRIYTFTIVKTQSGCQKKAESFCIIYCEVLCRGESEVLKRNRKNKNLTIAKKEPSLWRQIEEIKNPERVVVVGAGPAGLLVPTI